jgi:putative ABC transport system permease protein
MIKRESRTPRFASWILKRIINKEIRDGAMGDLEEQHNAIKKNRGRFFAYFYYWIQIFVVLPGFIKNTLYWTLAMFKNYVKVSFRNIIQHRAYSMVNVCGLAVGMAIFIMVFLYARHEYSYDKFHDNRSQIYRVEQIQKNREGNEIIPLTPAPLASVLNKNYPEVKDTVRILKTAGQIRYKEKKFYEHYGYFTDSSFFSMFNFPFVKGHAKTALREPFSIVLTEKMAQKYFKETNPIGRILKFRNRHDLKVTGVLKEIPTNSQFKFNHLVSFPTLRQLEGDRLLKSWDANYFYTYIKIQEHQTLSDENKKIRNLLNVYRNNNSRSELYLMPFLDIRLYSNTNHNISNNMVVEFINLLIGLGIFSLLIAAINFINLTTAFSAIRIKEIGIRKVVGSTRYSLIRQFLLESIILTLISTFLALILANLFLPEFKRLLNTNFTFNLLRDWQLLIEIFLISLIVGFLAGGYPAFVLSSYRPINGLKRTADTRSKKGRLRKIMVTVQFAITIILIVSTIIFYQLGIYIKHKDMGFKKKDVLVQSLSNFKKESIGKTSAFTNELLANKHVINTSFSWHQPYSIYSQIAVDWQGNGDNQKTWITHTRCDYNYIDLYEIKLYEGRNFSKMHSTDRDNACIINETAAKTFGWISGNSTKSPLGKQISVDGQKFSVIGIIKDFHSTDMRLAIRPLMIRLSKNIPSPYNYLSIKISTTNQKDTLAFIKEKYKAYFPQEIYDLKFLEDNIGQTFGEFDNVIKLLSYISFLAIFVASLGLFALASFTTKRRTKEIGIRKVVGATVKDILVLLSKEFAKILIMSNVIAWPIVYFFMYWVLQQFYYRIDIQLWVFMVTGLLTFIVAILTISTQSLKAALVNPVDSLRYE